MILAANTTALLTFLGLTLLLQRLPISPGWSALNLLSVILAPVALTVGRLFLWPRPQLLVYAGALLPALAFGLWMQGTFTVVDAILASFGAWAWLGAVIPRAVPRD